MNFDLFSRRLIIVSGKGGVGKSTVAVSLALLAAERGKRVLVVELDSTSVSDILGKKSPGFVEKQILPNLWLMNLSPLDAMEEYAKIRLKFKPIYQTFLKSDLYTYLSTAIPGLRELMTLGKIWYMEQLMQGRPRKPRFDHVIVDAPATGHGLLFLKIPEIAVTALRVGPVVTEARKIFNMLADGKKTSLCLVTIPEEMPVNEAVEMYSNAREFLKISLGPVFVNSIQEEIFSGEERTLLEKLSAGASRTRNHDGQAADRDLADVALSCINFQLKRRELSIQHLERLKSELPGARLIEIPYIFSKSDGEAMVRRISRIIGAGL